MISYFTVAHCTFITNFLSRCKPQVLVRFGHGFFPLKMRPFQANISQKSTNCLLANGWWNACFYHYSFYKKRFPSLLTSTWFVARYFTFEKQTVLVVFTDYSFVTTKFQILFFKCLHMVVFEYCQYISSLIYLSKFFLYLDADSASLWKHLLELFVNI